MLTTDPTFHELNLLKIELKTFVTNQFDSYDEHNKNYLINILKKVILIKYLIRQKDDYRLQAMLSDLIHLIRCLKEGEIRYYYLNLRSLIEQALRIGNNVESTDTITNTDIMNKTESYISSSQFAVNLDIIKNEYSRSCLYVHGNSNANMPLAELYFDCINQSREIEGLNQKLSELVKLLKELFKTIFISNSAFIDAAFHRRKTILLYLTDKISCDIITKS